VKGIFQSVLQCPSLPKLFHSVPLDKTHFSVYVVILLFPVLRRSFTKPCQGRSLYINPYPANGENRVS
jgi:hypothetical protein